MTLVFSIYINDLINSINKFNFLMCADDTTLYFNFRDFPVQNRSMLTLSDYIFFIF